MLKQMKCWTILCLFMALLTVLAGCGPAATPTPGPEKPTPEAVEKVTIGLWIFEGEEEFLPKLEGEFESRNPNIDLVITEIPEDDYVTKIDTALAAGAPPDIGFVYERRWLKAGHILSLDEMIENEGIELENYAQGALMPYCNYEGSMYCFGSYTGGMLLFYNKDMFDAAGLDYPSATEPMTVDEYAELADKLSNYAENIEDRVWGGGADVMLYWSDTAYLFSEDGHTVVANDEATVHAHQVLADMVIKRSSPSPADLELVGGADLMAQKKQAMWVIDNIIGVAELEAVGDIRWGVAPVPVEKEGDEAWVSAWTDAFGVFAASDHPEEARKFIAFLATEGNRLRAEVGGFPLDLTMAEEMDWAGDSEGRQELVQVMALARTTKPSFIPGFWDVTDPLWDAWTFMATGEQTAQEALDEASTYMQENLDLAWETWEEID